MNKDKTMQYTRKKIEAFSYGLTDQIGKGYSSKVYKGRHDKTNESVAVKVIDLKLLKNQINKSLLDSQIQILKQLKDRQNILYIHDVYTTKNNTYIISELCHSDLAKRIKKGLVQQEVYYFMKKIIKGYQAIYQKLIVHRDLKPANLLITEEDDLKIADFGFAIKSNQLEKASKYNVGSPLYMAPQSLKKNDYSFKSDIWAIGIIFYEMLMNDTPWRARSQKQLLKKIQTQPINDVLEKKDISLKAKQFIRQSLKVNKDERMEPKELFNFTFEEEIHYNILSQRKTHHQNRLNNNDKVQKKMNQQIPTSSLKNIQNIKHRQIVQKNKKSQDKLRQNNKLISRILISQVHFCRFLYKLIIRIKQMHKNNKNDNLPNLQPVLSMFTNIIKNKITNLYYFKQRNYINCQGYQEYKRSTDFEKLNKISRQYCERYKLQLKQYWQTQQYLSSQSTSNYIYQLANFIQYNLNKKQNPQEQIQEISQYAYILDYLISAKQLIDMIVSNQNNYQIFAFKSKIQQIVEGKNQKMEYQLAKLILNRAKQQVYHHNILNDKNQGQILTIY